MYMQSTLINMYIQCTFNNNVSHNVHCDFFNVSRMYVPMYMRSTCRYIKCSSQIDLMYIFSDVHEMYVKFLADSTCKIHSPVTNSGTAFYLHHSSGLYFHSFFERAFLFPCPFLYILLCSSFEFCL